MLALYIHWPFCVSKCPYCDFNSHVFRRIDEAQWQAALIHEIKRYAALVPSRSLRSVFFGGGTPSLMKPKTVAGVLEAVSKIWPLEGIEITLEANPNSVEVERFKGFKQAGVNRVSIGIQALNDAALKQLGREHSCAEGLKAIEIAQQTFERVSFDLIYARPGQTLSAWQQELSQALSFGTEHLSLYQLTIEAGTKFATLYQRGELVMPSEDVSADLYDFTQEATLLKGMLAYEVSNHARRGAESQHNLMYWRYQDYIGVGPGAHGRLTFNGVKYATRQEKAPGSWFHAIQQKGHGDAEVSALTLQEQAEEQVMMGLRLAEGLDLSSLAVLDVINKDACERLGDEGYLIVQENKLIPTDKGRRCLTPLTQAILK